MAGRPAGKAAAGAPSSHGAVSAVEAIQLRKASASMGGHDAWSDVDLTVHPGEFMAVLGSNGSGKSTLLKAILGLVETPPGSVRVLGVAPGQANRQVGYLPQRHGFDSSLPIRGVDLVRLGLDGSHWGLAVGVSGTARRRARGGVGGATAPVG